MSDAIILFAHGSRDPAWAAPLETLHRIVSEQQPLAHVALAFLELMRPDLTTALNTAAAQGARTATIVPVFLAAGGHLKKDLPLLIAEVTKLHPQLAVSVLPPVGEVDAVLQAIAAWIGRTVGE